MCVWWGAGGLVGVVLNCSSFANKNVGCGREVTPLCIFMYDDFFNHL